MNFNNGNESFNFGGLGAASFITIGSGGSGEFYSQQNNNKVTVSNATLVLNIGSGQNYWGGIGYNNNVLTVLTNGILVLSNSGGNLNIGNDFNGSLSNALVVSGGVVTNNGTVSLAGGTHRHSATGAISRSPTAVSGLAPVRLRSAMGLVIAITLSMSGALLRRVFTSIAAQSLSVVPRRVTIP